MKTVAHWLGNKNQNWHERVLPGGSLLVPECSSSLDRDAAVCLNRQSFLLKFSSEYKHAELDYTHKRIDLRLMALRKRIIHNSLAQDLLFLWIGSRTPLIFPFVCKLKGEKCPKLPGDYCLKAGREAAPAFCVEVCSFWWWRTAPDPQNWILTSDDTIRSATRKFIFWNESQIQFPRYTSHLNITEAGAASGFSVHQSGSGFCVCQGDINKVRYGWHSW